MRFEFSTAARIVFGPGTVAEIGTLAAGLGRRALVVTGRSPERAMRLLGLLRAAQIDGALFPIPAEPSIDDISRGTAYARTAGCDLVIGIGGGAALDSAKAIAALLTNPGDLVDYLEVIGQGRPLLQPGLPCIAIPTTAGTGSEVTRNAVLASPEHRVKVSLRSPHLLPRIALIDPELTRDLPPTLTATTGLDALTQLIEPYVSTRANPMTDPWCLEGIRRVTRSLRRAFEHGDNLEARTDMCIASVLGGLALANAGLGAAHGLAGPIGGMFPAPHGAICAALLPHVMATNIAALRARAPQHDALTRYTEVARILTGDPNVTAEAGVLWVSDLVTTINIPPLRVYGVASSDAKAVVEAGLRASSMKSNPLPLTPTELVAVFERAF
jgi:alcohol dehydrogenase class IV